MSHHTIIPSPISAKANLAPVDRMDVDSPYSYSSPYYSSHSQAKAKPKPMPKRLRNPNSTSNRDVHLPQHPSDARMMGSTPPVAARAWQAQSYTGHVASSSPSPSPCSSSTASAFTANAKESPSGLITLLRTSTPSSLHLLSLDQQERERRRKVLFRGYRVDGDHIVGTWKDLRVEEEINGDLGAALGFGRGARALGDGEGWQWEGVFVLTRVEG